MSKKIDIKGLKPVIGPLYPPPFDEPCLSREEPRLGDAAHLTEFGVNLLPACHREHGLASVIGKRSPTSSSMC